jgi:signal peptide peptidase SppA
MSEYAARSALERMNLREVAVATHYNGLEENMRLLAAAVPGEELPKFEARMSELCAAYGFSPSQQSKPFALSGGIAIIPVHGSLINRFGYSWGYVTGYNFIRSQASAAMQDEDVTGIIYDINSYGGEAAGCFECVEDLKNLTAGKPTMAVVDSNCYSAAMAIATAADKIVAIPSAGIGSIGVVMMHMDMSAMLDKVGVKVTFIHSGDHKVDGNPYEALPASVKKSMQIECDKSRDKFVALVAKNRGMEEKTVRDTEAACYRADDALALGLIDAVVQPSVAVQAFLDELSGSELSTTQKEPSMANEDKTKPGADDAARTQELATAAADARKAERARMSGITGCEEAKGKGQLASHLALNTEMSVDDAKAILKVSAPEAAAAAPVTTPAADTTTTTTTAAAGNPFKEAMNAGKHPNVGTDDGTGAASDPSAPEANKDSAAAKGILGAYKSAGGQLRKPAKEAA